MQIGTSARRLAAVLGFGAFLVSGTAVAQTADWQAGAGNNWRDVLAKAKAEGKVVVAGHPALSQPLTAGFERDTGIPVEYVGGSPPELLQRLSREAKASNLTIDVSLGGGAELPLMREGLLTPVKDQFMLPSVTEGKNWHGGQIKWMDKEGRYLFQGSNWVFAWPTFNSDIVKPGQVNTWQDLLKPEYKGKIASYDPRSGCPGQAGTSYLTELFGIEFVKKLYIGQEVTYTRDGRQLLEFAARGVYPVILCAVQFDIERYKAQGIKNLNVVQLSDGPGTLVGGFSVAKQAKGAPHPAAATVFLNWYASQPGQTEYTRRMLEPSTRVDVNVPEVPDYTLPKPGAKYLDQYVEDWYMDRRPKVAAALVEALGGR